MAITKTNSFDLRYPDNSGFEKTVINFYTGEPDLEALFLSEESGHPNRLFVTDTTIAELPAVKKFISRFEGGRLGSDALVVLGAGEKFKTMESALKIAAVALDAEFNRNCLFVGIGGGVVCDMTGFAASIFKRGVDVQFVSTTLLSDVDASIGGKTGCDFGTYKNMIGAFWPAKKIHIWSSFIKTLPEKEFHSGLAEAMKTALLFSGDLQKILAAKREKVMSRDDEIMGRIIFECASAKAKIVHEDFRERGCRAFLNYGHTFGHALESVAGLGEITHGEAVAWGMGRAIELSRSLGLCGDDFANECKALLSSYGYDTEAIPKILSGKNDAAQEILSAMKKDKKNSSRAVRVILQDRAQSTIAREVSDTEILSALKP